MMRALIVLVNDLYLWVRRVPALKQLLCAILRTIVNDDQLPRPERLLDHTPDSVPYEQ
jgi:hypothetical protein